MFAPATHLLLLLQTSQFSSAGLHFVKNELLRCHFFMVDERDCSMQGSIPEAHLDKFTGHDYLPGISGDQGSEIFLSCCGLSFRGLEDEIEKNQRDPSRAWK